MSNYIRAAVAILLAASIAAPAFAQSDAAALYKSRCAMCHGPDGKSGTAMGKKLAMKGFDSPDVAKMSDSAWIALTTNGKDKMPAYKGKLTDDQIKGLVKYCRSLK